MYYRGNLYGSQCGDSKADRPADVVMVEDFFFDTTNMLEVLVATART